jgi:hypothetical protein
MQRTADFHDQVANTRLPQAVGIVDDATTLDTAIDVLDAHTTARDTPIGGFLGAREGAASRLPGRHNDLHLVQRKRQEAHSLEQPTSRRQGVRGGIGHAFVVGAARRGLTQKENREHGIDQQHVFDRMILFLAAITARLLSRIRGALDTPFGPIVTTRGEAGAGAGSADGGDPSGGTTMAATSASATPRRWANSVKDRLGASPRARNVARSTTKRT